MVITYANFDTFTIKYDDVKKFFFILEDSTHTHFETASDAINYGDKNQHLWNS